MGMGLGGIGKLGRLGRPAPGKGGGGGPIPFQITTFANGEKGWAILPGTQFGRSYVERTSPTTLCTNGSSIGTYIDDITGVILSASADARRPIYTVASGKIYCDFDGSDDCLFASAAIDFSSSDKATLITAYEVDTSGLQMVTEFGPQVAPANDGSFFLVSSGVATGDINMALIGDSALAAQTYTAGAAIPRKVVTSTIFDIAGATVPNEIKLRIGGAAPSVTTSGNAGAGNMGNFVPYIGARANASLRLNGRIWGQVCVNRVMPDAERDAWEAYFTSLS